jgi:hypothetical protein
MDSATDAHWTAESHRKKPLVGSKSPGFGLQKFASNAQVADLNTLTFRVMVLEEEETRRKRKKRSRH